MFSLLWGLWEYATRKAEYHVLFVGLDAAGKTTVLEKLKVTLGGPGAAAAGSSAERIGPTVGLNIARLDVAGSALVLWDLGGAAGLRSIWDKYYAEAEAVVFVLDAADGSRLEEAKDCLARVLQARGLAPGLPVLVFANKQDAGGALAPGDVARSLDLPAACLVLPEMPRCEGGRRVRVLGCSALEGRGLQEGISWLLEACRRRATQAAPARA